MGADPKPNRSVFIDDGEGAVGICDSSGPKVLGFFELERWVRRVFQPKPVLLYGRFLNRSW